MYTFEMKDHFGLQEFNNEYNDSFNFKDFVKLTDKNRKDVFKCITNRFKIKYTNKTNVKK